MKRLVFVGLTMAMVFSVRAISLGLSVSGITRPNSEDLADDFNVIFIYTAYQHYYSGSWSTYTTYSEVKSAILKKDMSKIPIVGYGLSIGGKASTSAPDGSYLNFYQVLAVVLNAKSIKEATHYAIVTGSFRVANTSGWEVFSMKFEGSPWQSINEGKFTKNSPTPVPYEWLDGFPVYLQAQSGDYERAAMSIGQNGCKLYESYIAGLDPTDPKSTFRTMIGFEDGKPVVSWDPALNGMDENGHCKKTGVRTYRVLGSTDLKTWSEVIDGEESKYNFFKVNVEIP